MARPKQGKTPEEPTNYGIAVRGCKEWRDWVNEFADFRRLKTADLIDQALVAHAEQTGFKKKAPKR